MGRATSRDRPNTSFGAAQRRQPAGALPGYQRFETGPNDGGFLAQAAQRGRAPEQGVVDVQCGAHMHQYASTMHIASRFTARLVQPPFTSSRPLLRPVAHVLDGLANTGRLQAVTVASATAFTGQTGPSPMTWQRPVHL